MFISDFLGGSGGAGGEPNPIGAILDMAGVPNYQNDGSSAWMKNNTWVDGDELTIDIRGTLSETFSLAAAGNNASIESFRQLNSIQAPGVNASATTFPLIAISTLDLYALTIDATGVTVNAVGVTSGYGSASTNGGASLMTSDGTTLYCWTPDGGASAFKVRTSADGKTWAAATLTGQPTFSTITSLPMGSSQSAGSQGDTLATGTIFSNDSGSTGLQFVQYFGARHLGIARKDASYFQATLFNGLASNGDASVAVLGSSTIALSTTGFWYHSPGTLKGFFALSTVARFTVDGGVTWAAASGFSFANPVSSQKFGINASDPDRLWSALSGSDVQFSTDGGATWTLRSMPVSNVTSICARGSTVLVANGSVAYKSTNDGATWSLITGIAGMNGLPRGVYADATRFYIHTSGNQVVRSTDATTWSVSNISTAEGTTSQLTSIAATDANTIMLARGDSNNLPVLYSTDGAVTWKWIQRSSATEATGSYSAAFRAVTTGTPAFVGGTIGGTSSSLDRKTGSVIEVSDLVAGGASFRASSAAVSAVRTGASAYIRVA